MVIVKTILQTTAPRCRHNSLKNNLSYLYSHIYIHIFKGQWYNFENVLKVICHIHIKFFKITMTITSSSKSVALINYTHSMQVQYLCKLIKNKRNKPYSKQVSSRVSCRCLSRLTHTGYTRRGRLTLDETPQNCKYFLAKGRVFSNFLTISPFKQFMIF